MFEVFHLLRVLHRSEDAAYLQTVLWITLGRRRDQRRETKEESRIKAQRQRRQSSYAEVCSVLVWVAGRVYYMLGRAIYQLLESLACHCMYHIVFLWGHFFVDVLPTHNAS